MLKLCGEAICRPLIIIFKTCLNTGKFPSEWKKGNVAPIHKKDDKRNIKNYRPVSLLPMGLFTYYVRKFLRNFTHSPPHCQHLSARGLPPCADVRFSSTPPLS